MSLEDSGPSTCKWKRLKGKSFDKLLTEAEVEMESERIIRFRVDENCNGSEDEYCPSSGTEYSEMDSEVEDQEEQIEISNPNVPLPIQDWIQHSEPPNNIRNFMYSDLMNFIVEETNRNALTVLSLSTSEKARISAWKELTIDEFKIFLGLLYHMGSIQLSRIQDYWKTDRLFKLPLFRGQMSRNRFLLILSCLNFSSDNNETNTMMYLKKSEE
ncbi:piggybac transposable element-derived protein 4 [Holotrichia oblita]|uniref:Piggybac transposable element-derived protein 4 n=1 Tax=Holotrichia oblita TaxID=644536 RepID=A0ACB9TMC3_HOLOL|nr:piggybac transposable element-derived protein 4 [Holotrichia oblita]